MMEAGASGGQRILPTVFQVASLSVDRGLTPGKRSKLRFHAGRRIVTGQQTPQTLSPIE
jgi:hypothetical protein